MAGFAGRRALVTGAGHGIGRGIAAALAAQNAAVVATDVLADELTTLTGMVTAPCDLTQQPAIAALVAEHGHSISWCMQPAASAVRSAARSRRCVSRSGTPSSAST